MTQEPTVITAPIKEPVSISETTLQTRADYTTDNVLYAIWIAAARDYVESQCGITIHETTYEITLPGFPACGYITLPRATPLISVTSVIYYDTAGAATTLATSQYIVDTDSRPGRIILAYGESWPSDTLLPGSGVRIRYKAGIATTSPVTEAPGKIKHPILLLVNAMDRNRSAETVPDRKELGMIALQYGVDAFINRLRVESNSY